MNHRETMSRLNAALSSIDSVYTVIAKKHGLTFNALMVFYLVDESQNITQKQICDALHLPKSTVHSILLDFLKRDHLALIDGNNKKEKFVAATQKGNAFFQGILDETRRAEQNILDGLGEESCGFLSKIAETVSALAQKEIAHINAGGVNA